MCVNLVEWQSQYLPVLTEREKRNRWNILIVHNFLIRIEPKAKTNKKNLKISNNKVIKNQEWKNKNANYAKRVRATNNSAMFSGRWANVCLLQTHNMCMLCPWFRYWDSSRNKSMKNHMNETNIGWTHFMHGITFNVCYKYEIHFACVYHTI